MESMDQLALCEKIVKDVNQALSTNNLLIFEICDVTRNTRNKSPVFNSPDSLAIEEWCVKHVYTYCYAEIKKNFLTKPNRQISKITSVDAEQLLHQLNMILLLNPDLSSLWNMRRLLFLRGATKRQFETRFTRLVLSRKPKCNDAFAYRRWLFEGNIGDNVYDLAFEVLVNAELIVSETAADYTPNYHSWSHRIWLLNKLKEYNKHTQLEILYVREYVFSEKWVSCHVGDYSCHHYRQFCIKNLLAFDHLNKWVSFDTTLGLQQRIFVDFMFSNLPMSVGFECDKRKVHQSSDPVVLKLIFGQPSKSCCCKFKFGLLVKRLNILYRELLLNKETIKFFAKHDALWYHRRFIISEILQVMYDYFGVAMSKDSLIRVACKRCDVKGKRFKKKGDTVDIYESKSLIALINHEKTFCIDRRGDGDAVYADRHIAYLTEIKKIKGLF